MGLHSMTGYGAGTSEAAGYAVTAEIRTLNSRFIEVNVRLPRHLIALESDLINEIKATLKRGKVDLFIDLSREGQAADLPTLDEGVVRHYLEIARKVQTLATAAGFTAGGEAPGLAEILRIEGALSGGPQRVRGQDAAAPFRDPIFKAVREALKNTTAARAREGQALGQALRDLLDTIATERDAIERKRNGVMSHLRDQYVRRIENAVQVLQKNGLQGTGTLSDERIMTEVAVQSDKLDIEEELTRLKTHVSEFRKNLDETDAPGRKLDFLCQEMHREANTISNKLVQTDVSVHTIEIKQVIERIRQQVQNIE